MSASENAETGRQPGPDRVNKLTDESKLRRSARDVNGCYGLPELCAWQVEPGVFWIQATEPKFSRKLEKRQDTRRVEMNGINHYRRTFETRGTWRKIRRIIDRYLVSAGDQFSGVFGPRAASKQRGSIKTAAGANRRRKGVLVTGGVQ